MMKILIIENEFSYIETPFEYINDVYFENSIEYTVISKSQDLKPFNIIENYDFVFLDISLAKKSDMDGIGILNKIKEENLKSDHIVIITGNHLILEKLRENNLPEYKVLTKPIDFSDLLKIIRKN